MIIYEGAKLAILFDPVANRVLNVAPVTIGDQATPSGDVLIILGADKK